MNVAPVQSHIDASELAPESLAGNPNLTERQKIAEASRRFETILVQQILSETQKTVIKSEFSDNSTAAGIYQDLITNTLANDISKSGKFGLAAIFERQLSPPSSNTGAATTKDAAGKQKTFNQTSAAAKSPARPGRNFPSPHHEYPAPHTH